MKALNMNYAQLLVLQTIMIVLLLAAPVHAFMGAENHKPTGSPVAPRIERRGSDA
jgi:hypothetical protein